MPSLVIPPVINTPEKVQLARASCVYVTHPDLKRFHEFARDFGLVEVSREENVIYFRGFGKDLCIYVASQSKDGKRGFDGAAFVAQTEDDFIKASRLSGASAPELNPAPGGGNVVTISSPSGSKIRILWGQQERPEPQRAETATEISKGSYNTSLKKFRKGSSF